MSTPERFSAKEQRIEWIPNNKLSVIWVQSQRPYRESRAKKIAENFDPQRFDPIKVTLPNGKGEYHIVDGQHRKSAVEMLWGGIEQVPCMVLEAENPAEAARLFDGINGLRFSVDPVARFRVRVTGKNPVEVAVNKIVEHRGYKVAAGRSEEPKHGRSISAVGALIHVYTVNGPTVLDSILQILSATWPSDPYSTSSTIIRAYGQMLAEYENVDWGRLKEVVQKKYTPGNLMTHTKEMQNMNGGAMSDVMLDVLVKRYNRGLHPNKQLKRKTKKAPD